MQNGGNKDTLNDKPKETYPTPNLSQMLKIDKFDTSSPINHQESLFAPPTTGRGLAVASNLMVSNEGEPDLSLRTSAIQNNTGDNTQSVAEISKA